AICALLARMWSSTLTPFGKRRAESPPPVAAPLPFLEPHSHAHKLVGPAEIAVRFVDVHHIGDHSAAAAGNQRQGRLLHHCRINLSKPERLANICDEARKAPPGGIRPSPSH